MLRDWKHNDNAPHSFERGYGFITPDGGTSSTFVHATALRTTKGMAVGARVEYTELRDEHQRPQARDVFVLDLGTRSQKRQKQTEADRAQRLDSSLDELVARARRQEAGLAACLQPPLQARLGGGNPGPTLKVRSLEQIKEDKRKQAKAAAPAGRLGEIKSRLGGGVAVSKNGSGSTCQVDGPFGKGAKEKRGERFGISTGASSSSRLAASNREEKRYDDDGRGGRKLYTKAEFVKEYGSTAEWDAAPRAQPVALRACAPAPLERRFDTDGHGGQRLYTKAEFFQEYGNYGQWERAPRAPPLRASAPAPLERATTTTVVVVKSSIPRQSSGRSTAATPSGKRHRESGPSALAHLLPPAQCKVT